MNLLKQFMMTDQYRWLFKYKEILKTINRELIQMWTAQQNQKKLIMLF